ncbi:MAG: hypothetical protein GX051_03525 [Clostridiales bacterium]|nr:hypothetical protein [Clostridiales bacterium]
MYSCGFSELFSRAPKAIAHITGCGANGYVSGEISIRSRGTGSVILLEAVNLPAVKSGLLIPAFEPADGSELFVLNPVKIYSGYVLCAVYFPAAPSRLNGAAVTLCEAVISPGGVIRGSRIGQGRIKKFSE